jgi:hypothetical protein
LRNSMRRKIFPKSKKRKSCSSKSVRHVPVP